MKKYFSILVLWFLMHLLTLYVSISISTKDFINISAVDIGFWFVVVTIPFLAFLIYGWKQFSIKAKINIFYFVLLFFLIVSYVFLAIVSIPLDNSQKGFFLLGKWLFLGGQIILGFLVYTIFFEKKTANVLTEDKFENSEIELTNLESELTLLLKKQGAYKLEEIEGGLSLDQKFKLEQDLLTMNDRIIAIKEQIQVLINNPV